MENASKALIIAGAILLSISIIGIGMFIFNMASEATKNISMDDKAVAAYNREFEQYGGKQKGTKAQTLCDVVRSHNLSKSGDPSMQIQVLSSAATSITAQATALASGSSFIANGDTTSINNIKKTLLSGKLYDIDFGYDKNTGLIVAVGIH